MGNPFAITSEELLKRQQGIQGPGETDLQSDGHQRQAQGRAQRPPDLSGGAGGDPGGVSRRRLEQRTGREVRLRTRVDPAVLGGVRLETEGRCLDGTVRRRHGLMARRLHSLTVTRTSQRRICSSLSKAVSVRQKRSMAFL